MPAGAGGGTSAVPLADQAVKVGAGRRGPSCIPYREPTTMTVLPDSKTSVIAGAGIHGLSTAWHLAMELEARGKSSGQDIVVLDQPAHGADARPAERRRGRDDVSTCNARGTRQH